MCKTENLKKIFFFHAEQENLPYHVGNVLTSDLFYEPEKKKHEGLQFADMGVLAVEMETAALYANAALSKARALSILTVCLLMVTLLHCQMCVMSPQPN